MITEPLITHKPERRTATIHLVVPPMDMPKYMDPAIQEVLQVLAEQGVKPMGPLFSYHHRRPADTFEFEIGFAVNGEVKPQGRVKPSTLPASRVVSSLYTGPYEGLGGAWGELERWVRAQGHVETGRFWEAYLSNPEETPDPADYRTELNWILG